MSKLNPHQSPKLFLLLSLLIAFLDITFVAITYFQSQQALVSTFEKEARNQHTTFRNSFRETVNNMLQIATFVANDPRIQQAFLQGKLAVESEGGGKGKEQAEFARDHLLTIVAPSWAEMTKQFKARQLHFHLGPGSTSFLRVHKPQKFGDNMDDVRYTIVDANRSLRATSGFETGRVYSGIRGVQPIFAISPLTNHKVHVGAVESGISFHDLLHNLSQTFDIDIVVLLTMDHIEANVWKDFLEKRFKKSPPFGDLVVEETTSLEFKKILGIEAIAQSEFSSDQVKTVFLNNHYFVVSEMMLRDYRGSLDKTLADAGKIVFWKDVTLTYTTFISDFKSNLIYAITAYVMVEILLFFGLRKTNKIIVNRTRELSKMSLVVEQNPTVIIITSNDGIVEYVNHKFLELTGYSFTETINKPSKPLISNDSIHSTYDEIKNTLLKGKEWHGELKMHKKNKEEYWVNEYSSPIYDDRGNISNFVFIQEDITEHRQLTKEITYQASHDSLTGLINRREFEKRLKRLIQTAKQKHTEHIFCFFDLDKFKIINDTSGHPAGDELLRQIAYLTQNHIRQRDTLARFGGDEFGILMESCSMKQAESISEALRDKIENYTLNWEAKSFSVSASIGIIAITHQTQDVTEAFKHADIACYAAKEGGRNQFYVYQAENPFLITQKNELDWANETVEAIAEGRMALFAQVITPITEEKTKKIRFEILVRQYTREGQMLSPAQFLPAMERYNLAVKLDSWVIQATFDFLNEHLEQINNIEYFAINLSGQSLGNEKVLKLITHRLDSTSVPAKKIIFEITETVVIANITQAIQFISTLKEYGFRFALDDFGSGLSSFAYLKQLPVDYLKIDGLFVKDIADDVIDFAMVKSINEVGHLMGLETIAEFVENDAILQMLKTIDVDYAQGYGLGMPQPLADFFNS